MVCNIRKERRDVIDQFSMRSLRTLTKKMHPRVCLCTLFSAGSTAEIWQCAQSLWCQKCGETPQREDAVNSLAYEAEYRVRDPVYGCVGLISLLQHKLKQVQDDMLNAKKELTAYIGPSVMLPINLQAPGFIQQQHHMNAPSSSAMMPFSMNPRSGMPTGVAHGHQLMIRDPQQQSIEAQQYIAAMELRDQQEMLRNNEQQQQQDVVRFNNGFDSTSSITATTEFHQMSSQLSNEIPYNLIPAQQTQQIHLQP